MTRKSKKVIALFPGSFNPFTVGHKSLIERCLEFADLVIIGLGINIDKDNGAEIEKRAESIKSIFETDPRVEVRIYKSLTGEFARQVEADFIVRGVRNAIDFEYEMNLATANRKCFGIETVFLPALPELAWISSSLVRELDRFGHNTESLIP